MFLNKWWIGFGIWVLLLGTATIAVLTRDLAAAVVTALLAVVLLLGPVGGDDE
jgi:hypothetical protein